MSDEPTEVQPAPDDAREPGGAAGSWRDALRKRDSHGRPMAVYAILGAGVATLIGLMLIVYLWSADRDRPEQPICTTISAEQAQDAILDGKVESFLLAYSSESEGPTSSDWGPVQARLDYLDGQCGSLPQGVQHQSELFAILGAITFYNQTTDGAQLEVKYSSLANLDPILFQMPTVPPTETPEATESVVATPDATEAPSPTPTPTMEPTAPVVPASPMASPAQRATPERTVPTPTATP